MASDVCVYCRYLEHKMWFFQFNTYACVHHHLILSKEAVAAQTITKNFMRPLLHRTEHQGSYQREIKQK